MGWKVHSVTAIGVAMGAMMALIPGAQAESGQGPFVFSFGDGAADGAWGVDDLCESIRETLPGQCLVGAEEQALREAYQQAGFRYHVALAFDEAGSLELRLDEWGGPSSTVALMRQRWEGSDEGGPTEQALRSLETNIIEGPLGGERRARAPANYLRAGIWTTLSLGGAMWWYLSYDDLNSTDWDYTGFYSDDPAREMRPQIEKWRGLDGWRFDDNIMVFNSPLHPLAGAGYYITARSSNLGPLGSFATAMVASFLWEVAIEHHEVMSVNDMVATGIAGVPLGEAYYQLGQFFRRAEPTLVNRSLAWVFAAPRQLHDLIDGRAPLYLGERNGRGWPVDLWHRFEFSTGLSLAQRVGSEQRRFDGAIAGSAQLMRLPDYGAPGEHSDWYWGPLGVALSAALSSGGGDNPYSWNFYGATDFGGYYHQDMRPGAGGPVGVSHFVGTGMAFRHTQHRYEGWLDRYSTINFPGIRLEHHLFAGPIDLRLSWGGHPDFTHTDALAYPVYEEATGRVAARSVLATKGYYYGLGVTHRLGLEANLWRLQLRWNWEYHWAQAIEAFDRHRDDVARFGPDLDGYLRVRDTHNHHRLEAMVDLPGLSALQAGVIGDYRGRRASVEDDGQRWENELGELRGLGVVRLVY